MNSKKTFTFLGVVVLLLASFLFLGRVAAKNSGPSSPIYPIGRWYEGIELKFAGWTGGSLSQAEVHLNHAEKRIEDIAEIVGETEGATLSLTSYVYAQVVDETELTEEEVEQVEELTQDYEQSIDSAILEIEVAQEDGLDTDEVSEIVATATVKHQEVLAEVYEKVPVQAKEAIQNAMQKGETARERAMEAVSEQKREEVRERVEEKKAEAEGRREQGESQRPEELPSQGNEENGAGQGSGNAPETTPQGRPESIPSGR